MGWSEEEMYVNEQGSKYYKTGNKSILLVS